MSELESNDVYARGWIITLQPERVSAPGSWRGRSIGPWKLFHDPRLPLDVYEYEGTVTAVLGFVTAKAESGESARSAARALSNASGDRARQLVNRMSGRFVIFTHNVEEDLRIENDAVGLRAVYYSDAQYPPVAGSHASLVAGSVGAPPGYFGYSDYLAANNFRTHPGRTTSKLGIMRLTPNCRLDMKSRTLERIYPNSAVVERSVQDVADLIIDSVSMQLCQLSAAGRSLVCSLSAGLDSRVTLALLRDTPNVEFFTYDIEHVAKNKASEHDRDTALRIAKRFDLRHRVLSVSASEIPKEALAAFKANSPLTHSRSLAHAYKQAFPGEALHVRSNVYEVGRAYYRTAGFTFDRLDARSMRDIASNGKSRDRGALDAFAEYSNMTDFGKVERLGFDGMDFLYWEHRMGVWMTAMLHESDVAFDTHILVNSREILDAMLGLTLEERASGALLVEIIRRAWPELLEIPVNGEYWPV